MATTRMKEAPSHLSKETKRWWEEIFREFALESAQEKLLEAACDSWDRMIQARKLIANDGLPLSWVSPWDVSYYTGVAVDVNGKLINPNPSGNFKGVAIDEGDPPLYESEASYLERHGLFLPNEKKGLKAKDFEPETIAYVDSED